MLTIFLATIIPSAVANITPPIIKSVFPKFNFPLDFSIKIKGHRLLGENKTVRGFIFGTFFAQITYYFLITCFQDLKQLPLPNYYGILLGVAALTGDATKSFIKRRLSIPSGKSWVPYDQIDWILGVIFLNTFYISSDINLVLLSILLLITGFFGHIAFKYIGYILKLNKEKI